MPIDSGFVILSDQSADDTGKTTWHEISGSVAPMPRQRQRRPASARGAALAASGRRESMDRRELTTPLGFFNVAGSYRAAADKLRVCKLRATHPHSPIPFAYYHSIELYLKAFLRVHGLSAGFLADIRHDVKKLRKMCVARGLRFDAETEDVLALIATPGAGIRTRYLEVGFGRHPLLSDLARVCRKIDRAVGATLSDKGVLIRRMRRGVRASDGPIVAARQ